MKKSQFLGCCGAIGSMLLLGTTALAQNQGQGFYAKGALGAVLIEDVTVKNFLGVSNPGKFELDPGVRLDVGAGYNFNRWLAAEFETGFLVNGIENQHDSSLWNWPLLVNVVGNFPVSEKFVPFIGVGGGGVVSSFFADDFSVTPNTFVDGTDSDMVWAWQGFGGIRYNINEKLDVNISYKYLATGDPSYDAHEDFSGFHESIDFKGIKSHAILLGVNFRF